jgi:putative PIN family toxin of toxin-antitoxin system
MLRVVLDTNVFVSSLLSRKGAPSKVLDEWRAGKYLLVTSPSIISEIERVLKTPRIKKRYGIGQEAIEQLIGLLEKDAVVVPELCSVRAIIPQDPEDEKFLACAIDAGADLIVSGDRHLLDLGEHQRVPIVTVREFMDSGQRVSLTLEGDKAVLTPLPEDPIKALRGILKGRPSMAQALLLDRREEVRREEQSHS